MSHVLDPLKFFGLGGEALAIAVPTKKQKTPEVAAPPLCPAAPAKVGRPRRQVRTSIQRPSLLSLLGTL